MNLFTCGGGEITFRYTVANILSIGVCRHEKYVTQNRAVFVINCKIDGDQVVLDTILSKEEAKEGGNLVKLKQVFPVLKQSLK